MGTNVEIPAGNFDPVTPVSVPNMSYQHNGVPGIGRTRGVSPTDGERNVGTTPTLTGGTVGKKPAEGVEWRYTVCWVRADDCDTAPAARSGWTSASSWKVPSGKLAASATYVWFVQVRIGGYEMLELARSAYWFSTGDSMASPTTGDEQIRLRSPAMQSRISTLRPTLEMALVHAAPDDYEYSFTVWLCQDDNCSTTTPVADSGWITRTSWQVPAGALVWGATYKWTADSRSNQYISFLYTPENTFATTVPVPAGASFGLDSQATRVAGVSLSDRHFEHTATDAILPTAGVPLALARNYSSSNDAVGAFGRGWSSVLDMSVESTTTGMIVNLADGHQVGFGKNADGSFGPAAGSQLMSLESCSSPCMAKYTDGSGTVFQFGALGVTSIRTQDGQVTEFTRAIDSRITGITDVTSQRSFKVIWAGSRVTAVDLVGAPTGAHFHWRYLYDGENLSSVCRPAAENICTSYSYVGTPALLSAATTPDGGGSTTITYSAGAVAQVTNGNGIHRFASTNITGGKRVTVTNGAGAVDTYEIDGWGRTRKLTNSRGGVELWGFNNDGQTKAYKPADGSFVAFGYDDEGRLRQKVTYPEHAAHGEQGTEDYTVAYGIEQYEYISSGTAQGRPRLVTSPNSNYYFYSGFFDPPTLTELRANAAVEYQYDATGRISKIYHGSSVGSPRPAETYTYTTGDEVAEAGGTIPSGLIETVTDPGGNVTRFTYTKQGQLAVVTDPLGAKTTYSYDWAGRLLKTVKSGEGVASQTTTYTYTDTGLVESVESAATMNVITGGLHRQRVTFEHDGDGNVIREISRDLESGKERSVSYELDPFGRVLSATDADGVVQQRNTYDEHGNVVARTDADGRTVEMTYSPEGDLLRQAAVTGEDGGESQADLASYTYDKSGRVRTRTDRSGVTRQYSYYMDDRIEEVMAVNVPDGSGGTRKVRESAYLYNQAGDIALAQENGTTTQVTYDRVRRPVSIATNDGSGPEGDTGVKRETRLTYDTRGLITREQAMGGDTPISVTTNSYDGAGNLVQTSVGSAADDPTASTIRIDRDAFGRVVIATDPRSTTENPLETRYSWDGLDRAVTETSWSPQGELMSRYGYDAFGNQTNEEFPSGARVDRTFDAQDRMTSQTRPYRVGDEREVERWKYTPGGLLQEQADPIGMTSTYEHDALGQITSTTRTLGDEQRVERYAYDKAGNPVRYVDPEGAVTTAAFDWRGNKTEQTFDADGIAATWRYTYDELGRLTSETSPEGEATRAHYNALDEIVSITDVTGRTVEFSRDPAGRVVEQRDSHGATTWVNYDYADNPVRLSLVDPTSDAVLRSWGWTYDRAGLQTRQVDPLGGVREFTYDQRENLTELVYEDGATSRVEYDLDGNPVTFTDQRGNKTTATYTPNGDLTALVEPAVAGATEPGDRTFTWDYDAAGREIASSTPDGVATATTYNIDGMPTKVTAMDADGTSERTFTYDAAGRMTGFSHPDGVQEVSYDDMGRLTTSDGPVGDSAFTYDRDGRMLSQTDAAGTSTYTWDAGDQLASAELPDGDVYEYQYANGDLVAVDGPSTSERLEWDLLGNVTSQAVTSGTQQVVQDTYTHDAVGNRLSVNSNRNGGTQTGYEYDLRNRLTGWTDASGDHTVNWDAANNLIAVDGQTREYNARNQLLSIGARTFDYSPAGLRTRSGQDEYTYDRFGQLTSDGNHTFAYDGLGRMVAIDQQQLAYLGLARDPSTIGDTATTRDPLGGLLELGGSRAISDPHGDIIAVAASDGAQTVAYDPFGQPTESIVANGPGFQGDVTSGGMVNMDARWYDPSTATFITRDNIDLPLDEQNRYAYAMGNPVRYSDPTGHCAMAAPVCAGAAGGGAVAGPPGAVVGAVAGLAVMGIAALAYNEAGYSLSDTNFSSWSYTLPGRSPSETASSRATTSAAALTSFGTAAGLGSISVPDMSAAVPRTGGYTYSSSSYDFSQQGSSISTANANISRANANISNIVAGISQISASIARINIPKIDINIPKISIDIPEIRINIPQFGIDRPSWAYPDPFVAANVRPVGQAAGGVSTALCGVATAACTATIGTLGASCAAPGAGPTACSPTLAAHLWAAVPEAGNTAASGAAAGAGANGARSECGPDQVLTELGCQDLLKILQDKVNEVRDSLRSNKSLRDDALSDAELKAESEKAFLEPMNNGKAIERIVARDPLIRRHFEHQGGASRPDFVARTTNKMYELTTNNPSTIADHLRRSYVAAERIAKYVPWKFGS
ncbi:RHS repeat-associated core domain-containing protein [Promicromonospora panici]|uniref:RHS repeat-associated core domain-containing protein n=1 Tax=Promicromonospora panici TaxID=2219658 RepID=UPI0013EADD4E|nr:RHS repeat-associated core domain-containing protein [Promicromonospora panici]